MYTLQLHLNFSKFYTEHKPVFVLVKGFKQAQKRFNVALFVDPIIENLASRTHGFFGLISHESLGSVFIRANVDRII